MAHQITFDLLNFARVEGSAGKDTLVLAEVFFRSKSKGVYLRDILLFYLAYLVMRYLIFWALA